MKKVKNNLVAADIAGPTKELHIEFKASVASKYMPGDLIQLRDQRQYLVLGPNKQGLLMAEVQNDHGKMSEVYFWSNEFLESMIKRNNIVKKGEKHVRI